MRRHLIRALYLMERAFDQLFSWRRLGIRRRDLVLDVGSGCDPFIRADVLCDKFLFDNTERARDEPPVVDRPFVVGDGTRLPFRDKAFDFSYTRHLIEHLDDPERHLRELERVSRRGVIIAPAEAWERVYSMSVHRWLVSQAGSRLRLTEKPRPIMDEYLSNFFDHCLGPLGRYGFSYFWHYYRDLFEVQYRWEGKIEFEIDRLPAGTRLFRLSADADKSEVEAVGAVVSPAKRRLKTAASRITRRLVSAHFGKDVWPLLACPECHGELARASDHVACRACGRHFRLHDGRIPVLLP